MGEVGNTVSGQYLRGHAALAHLLRLELHHVQFLGHLGEVVQIQVHVGSGKILHGGKALSVLAAGIYLLHQFLGDYLASAVMAGILAEHLGFEGPVLVYLRGQFHEVALHTAGTLILHVAEE